MQQISSSLQRCHTNEGTCSLALKQPYVLLGCIALPLGLLVPDRLGAGAASGGVGGVRWHLKRLVELRCGQVRLQGDNERRHRKRHRHVI